MLEPKGDEVTGVLTEMYSKRISDLFYSENIIIMILSRIIRWTAHVRKHEYRRNAYQLSVGKLEMKKPIRRPVCR
jgi:hypothetical protein